MEEIVMGLFGPYVYTNKKGKKFYLHEWKSKGGKRLLHFSKDRKDAIDLPPGFKVVENPRTGLPILKKKE
jgi:hypothetical protein